MISTVITKKLSVQLKTTPRLLHITVQNNDGVMSSTVHCCTEVAKFNMINTTNTDDFIKYLEKGGFDCNLFALRTMIEIHDLYNSVLDSFR